MSEIKRGRKPLPDNMRAITTSLRLRPDRLLLYKSLGGIKWFNSVLDEKQHFYNMLEDSNEMGKSR
jgi:hypothetical protein